MSRREHHCHGLRCATDVPPRMHMCPKHWRMVPAQLKADLLANYVRGQERTMTPTAAYLRAAAACVRSVAEQEGLPADEIDAEVGIYEAWAEMVDEGDWGDDDDCRGPATLFDP